VPDERSPKREYAFDFVSLPAVLGRCVRFLEKTLLLELGLVDRVESSLTCWDLPSSGIDRCIEDALEEAMDEVDEIVGTRRFLSSLKLEALELVEGDLTRPLPCWVNRLSRSWI
jgi:hypothetical protein